MKITNRVVEDYFNCRYKAFLRLKGEIGTPHHYEGLMNELTEENRPKATEALLRRCKLDSAPRISSVTFDDLQQGRALILDCTIETYQFHFHFDALKKLEGNSSLGSFHYQPVLFCQDDKVREWHRHVLACGAFIVGQVQRETPDTGLLVVGEKCRLSRTRLSKFSERVQKSVEELKQITDGDVAPSVRLNKHCDVCEFRERCEAEAIEKDDLSLLRGISDADIEKNKAKGIFTLNQLSFTFRPRRRPKKLSDRPLPCYRSLQAQAIRERKVYVLNRPTIPLATTNVYLDMEGNSNATSVYLIGALIVADGSTAFHSFWADAPQHEAEIFGRFFELLTSLDDPHVFHYGSYEATAIKRVLSSVRTKRSATMAAQNSTNVLSTIYSNVYFPTFSNGLKDIGRYLGCSWSDEFASGLQSVVWRTRWVRSGDSHLKDKLLQYNRDDCAALQTVTAYLSRIAAGGDTQEPDATVALVETLRHKEDYGKWGERKFAINQFRTIADCAYFDYQRSKVFVRTSPNLRKALRHQRKRRSLRTKPNVVVDLKSRKCWRCKGTDITPSLTRSHTKHQWDLRFSTGCIRRWITRYRTPFYRCNQCNVPIFSRAYKSKPRFGHNLVSWAMYQHVVNKMSLEAIELAFRECFAMKIDHPTIHGFKARAAQYYKRTYNQLLRRLVSGSLIHADETKGKLRQEICYVWVFTSMEEVVYIYRPSREGSFLQTMLADFSGVLVSDFYSAYDSLHCPQQKCLVHLMWDINSDLFKNPFDDDLKGLATSFGDLLRQIIATVDRFGLKARFLRRHKNDVRRFFKNLETDGTSSNVAEHYRERLRKHEDSLFTFLDYDGVPWNNNNAEHAIKPFAKYRRLAKRSLHANDLQDYLVLLSIWQTCEYRGISFLDFLLSRERDIDVFCQKVW